jgi:hypothetical protein
VIILLIRSRNFRVGEVRDPVTAIKVLKLRFDNFKRLRRLLK